MNYLVTDKHPTLKAGSKLVWSGLTGAYLVQKTRKDKLNIDPKIVLQEEIDAWIKLGYIEKKGK